MSLPHYLLGVAQLLFLVACALLAATSLRRRLLPTFRGAPSVLATTVLALAFLVLTAEILGSFGLLSRWPYLATVGVTALLLRTFLRRVAWGRGGRGRPRPQRPPCPTTGPAGRSTPTSSPDAPGKREGPPRGPLALLSIIALTIAVLVLAKFALETKPALSTGMTGFDTTWYHGPFAAGFFQSGDTWSLHLIAPQFLAWFYPANSELFHAVGMIAFERDVLSPLLNLGWLAACLLACWCVGRPYGVAPWSLALGALALSVPAFADQAGEARNDVVGACFLLAAVAIALNPGSGRTSLHGVEGSATGAAAGEVRASGVPLGAVAVAALAAGLAAGTKLNFLLPTAVLVVGLAWLAGPGRRLRGLAIAACAALLGGGYWYLRNLAHSGNPLPWVDSLGPISLPAPDQPLGGREGHSVLGYLTDATVWSDWLLPGLRDGLTILWPLLLVLALAGIALSIAAAVPHQRDRGAGATAGTADRPKRTASDPILALAGAAALATLIAWLIAPTSASGPDGIPRGFESGLRYLVPALVLALALLPAAPPLRRILGAPRHANALRSAMRIKVRSRAGVWIGALVIAIALGYPLQRHYLEHRYANPSFAAPGLNAAFAWSSDLTDTRIATTSTRQYPLYGPDLSNRVQFIGEEQPHGGFTAPADCPTWRRLLNEGDYDYVIASHDRIEPGNPPYPATARWTEGPGVKLVLRIPPAAVFQLERRIDPSACKRDAPRAGGTG